ncbi:MAG: hypothetical protein WC625_04775 [Caldisericia bacterium]
MKRVLALILVCALVSVSVAGHLIPAVKAAGEALYVEIPQDSYCRAPAATVYLPIMMGNLSDTGTMRIRSVEILGKMGKSVTTETLDITLESMAGSVRSGEEIRTALGIIPPTAADITRAQALIVEARRTADSKQKSILIEQAFFASRAKQSMKHPDELTADEARIQHLLKTTTLAVDLMQFATDTTSETAVPVTVRITGELAGQPFTVEQQTTVFLLASLPNGGMWHPGDGHVHTQGLTQPDTVSQYTAGYEQFYGFSDATDLATVLARRDQAYSKGMQWIVITDHAGDDSHFAGPNPIHLPTNQEPRLETDEWNIYKTACTRATTQYSPTVTVCPGEELATRELQEVPNLLTGHLLSYSNSSYAASFGTCGTLTTNVANAGGFGIIAHPFGGIFWSNWYAAPWRGLEVVSGQTGYSQQAVDTWDTWLRNSLSDEIAGTVRRVAMANSDVHSAANTSWGSNMNYIYTGSYSAPGTSPSAVWTSIKQGSLTASSDGSFAAATVNGVYPGYTASVARNSTVSVVITGTPVSTTYTKATVTVFLNGYALTPVIVTLTGGNFTIPYSVPVSADAYIRVEVSYGIGSNRSGYCFVNPVFIDTY